MSKAIDNAVAVLDRMMEEIPSRLTVNLWQNDVLEMECKSILQEARDEIASLPDGWISVEDRLPEKNSACLASDWEDASQCIYETHR